MQDNSVIREYNESYTRRMNTPRSVVYPQGRESPLPSY